MCQVCKMVHIIRQARFSCRILWAMKRIFLWMCQIMFISQFGKKVAVGLTVEGWKEVQGCFTTVLVSETYNLFSNLQMLTVTLIDSLIRVTHTCFSVHTSPLFYTHACLVSSLRAKLILTYEYAH